MKYFDRELFHERINAFGPDKMGLRKRKPAEIFIFTKSGVKPLISIMGIKAAQHSPFGTASWGVKHTPSEDGALHGDKTEVLMKLHNME